MIFQRGIDGRYVQLDEHSPFEVKLVELLFSYGSVALSIDTFSLPVFQFVQDGDPQAEPPPGAGAAAGLVSGPGLLPAAERGLQLPGPKLLSSQQMTGSAPLAPESLHISHRPLCAWLHPPSVRTPLNPPPGRKAGGGGRAAAAGGAAVLDPPHKGGPAPPQPGYSMDL